MVITTNPVLVAVAEAGELVSVSEDSEVVAELDSLEDVEDVTSPTVYPADWQVDSNSVRASSTSSPQRSSICDWTSDALSPQMLSRSAGFGCEFTAPRRQEGGSATATLAARATRARTTVERVYMSTVWI